MFKRNIGFISIKEQKVLARTSIGIAGVGGDGGLLAERLTRFGIGKLVLADPENFEKNNINRQFGANIKTLGKNKAVVIGKEIKFINPDIELKIFKKGINRSNVKTFVKESDVIIDEVEYTNPEVSVLLAQEARKQNKYIFMGANIGWGASIFCFSPKGMTFEKYFQYDSDKNTINPLKYAHKIPSYFDKKMLQEVLNGEKSMPSISSSVALVAALISSQIILFVIGKRKPVMVPKFKYFDTYNLK